jgi:hypothetical protein
LKKISLIPLLLGVILIVSCIRRVNKTQEDDPLTVFILGKWQAVNVQTTDVSGTYLTDYEVEFVNKTKLILCSQSSYDSFCADFTYRKINGDNYSVENDRAKGGQWVIKRDGSDLMLCIWSTDNCVIFKRAS